MSPVCGCNHWACWLDWLTWCSIPWVCNRHEDYITGRTT